MEPLSLVQRQLEPRPGRLLVASPGLVDPHFTRTVVLLLDVDDDGVLGVVLNRPTELPVGDVVADWSARVTAPDVVFVGGPVGSESALAVARTSAPVPADVEGFRPLFGATGLVDLDAPTAPLLPSLDAVRVYAGYAGWSTGQLVDEIREGAWYVVESEPADLFAPDPWALRHDVLARQEAPLAWLATYPEDVAQN